jgi:hypothetical protein
VSCHLMNVCLCDFLVGNLKLCKAVATVPVIILNFRKEEKEKINLNYLLPIGGEWLSCLFKV